MKKNILTIMTIACAMFMVSCGGKKSADAEANSESTEQTSEEFSGDASSIEAVEHYIQSYKLKFSDIEPSFSYNKEKTVYFNGAASGVDVIFCPTEGEFNTDMMTEAVKKIYAATKAIADGGKIIVGWEDVESKEAAMKELPLEEVLKGKEIMGMKIDQYSWAWQQDGKFRRCNIEEAEDLRNGDKIGYKVSIYQALEQSMEDQLEDAAKAIEDVENDPAKKAAVDKALKDAGLK